MALNPTFKELLQAEQLVSSPMTREFSWSFSRAQLFEKDKVAYWQHYYASWGGWLRKAPQSVREAYHAKQITKLPAWIGLSVHQRIAKALTVMKEGKAVDHLVMIRKMTEEMKGQWEGSEPIYSSFTGKPKLLRMDVFQREQPPNQRVLRMAQKEAMLSYQAFTKSKVARLATRTAKSRFSNQVGIEAVDEMATWMFEGTRVYGAPDVVLKTQTRTGSKLWLVDWKWKHGELDLLAKNINKKKVLLEQYRLQLQTYAVWAAEKYKVKPENIRLVSTVLHRGKEQTKVWRMTDRRRPFRLQSLEETKEYMRSSIKAMHAGLVDADPAKNFMMPPESIRPASTAAKTALSPTRTAASVAEAPIEWSKIFTPKRLKIGAGIGAGLLGLGFLLHSRAKHGDTNSHKNKHNRYLDQSQYNLGYNTVSRTSYTMGGVA